METCVFLSDSLSDHQVTRRYARFWASFVSLSIPGSLSFYIAWIILLFLWSIPIIVIEYALGRFTRNSVPAVYYKFFGKYFIWVGGWLATTVFFLRYVPAPLWCTHTHTQTCFLRCVRLSLLWKPMKRWSLASSLYLVVQPGWDSEELYYRRPPMRYEHSQDLLSIMTNFFVIQCTICEPYFQPTAVFVISLTTLIFWKDYAYCVPGRTVAWHLKHNNGSVWMRLYCSTLVKSDVTLTFRSIARLVREGQWCLQHFESLVMPFEPDS